MVGAQYPAAALQGVLVQNASSRQVPQPWPGIVEDVRDQVQNIIDSTGAFITAGDPAAFVCR